MKIAVISDIHGNVEALDAVLQDIKEQKCDKIFVLGDYAMAGPEPDTVVDFFMKKKKDPSYKMIQGNTDLMIADYSEELYNSLKDKASVMAEALKDDVSVLSEPQKKFLKELPMQLEVFEQGITMLLVHGSPRKNNEDILPDTSFAELDEMLKHVDANVILCGHTHIPCGFQTESKKTVVNVGSVGRPFTSEPKSCYLTITIEDGKTLYEHHLIKYDNEKAAEKLNQRNFIGKERLAATLINPKERHF